MTQKKTTDPAPRNGEETVKVRTTIRPDVELDVTEAERRDLEAQGLLAKTQKKES